jgi:hypothetical protein
MIDFSKITKTLDGFDCHYFGTRESFGRQVHCFAVFHPLLGTAEVQCDGDGKRLKFENGLWVESAATNYQIVKPMPTVEVTRWLCFKHIPTHSEDSVVVHCMIREPSADAIDRNKYFKVERRVWKVEVPE